MNSSWGDDEEAALQGLAYLAQLIYLRALRRFMDYATGLVGIARGISYQGIAETLYVEPVAGRHSPTTGKPSLKAIRNAIAELEKAGLIERKSTSQKLIFFLPLAVRDQSVQKRRGRGGAEEGQRKGRPEGQREGQTQAQQRRWIQGMEGQEEGQTE